MEKKQTAVQWLLTKHPELGMLGYDIIKQALQMEREQIEEAFDCGYNDYYPPSSKFDGDSDTYYTQTFKPEPMNTKHTPAPINRLIFSKIESCIGTYSNSLTKSITEDVYNKVIAPYEKLIDNIKGELDETQNGLDVTIESIKDMIDSFKKATE